MSINPLQLSPTVEHTRKQLGKHTAVYAVEMAKSILAQHTEYADKTPRPCLVAAHDAHEHSVDDWLAEVRSLLDSSLVPELNGMLVIIGWRRTERRCPARQYRPLWAGLTKL